MRKLILIVAAVSLSACSMFNKNNTSTPPSIFEFGSSITEEGLYADMAVLTHDSLQGRDTGTEGLEKAAHHLIQRYTEAGLQPVGDNNTYLQNVDFVQVAVQSIEYTVTNSAGEQVDVSVHNKDESGNFITLFGGGDAVEGPIVFAGKGMADDEGVNHFPDDVEGKWLMFFLEQQSSNMNRAQEAFAAGALGIITITTDGEAFAQEAEARKGRFGSSGRLQLAYLYNQNSSFSPSYITVNADLAARMLGLSDPGALSEVVAKIDTDPASFKAQELDYSLAVNPVSETQTVSSHNVVAFIEGSDPELKHEVVVLSSHYDHVGVGRPDASGDTIYNGADDNASGTVATLHTALAMQQAVEAGVGPRRSVLFLHVTAEEKGLLGSRYYSDNPIFPIENTVANINIDMIGRVDAEHVQDSNYVYIIGGEIISSGLDSLAQLANTMGPNMNLSKRYNDLNDPNQFYRRSDHWNFGRLGVPFVFFFNGVHDDYHRPSDHLEKITFTPYTNRTRLIYNLTALLANSDERPVVDNQEFIERTQVQPR